MDWDQLTLAAERAFMRGSYGEAEARWLEALQLADLNFEGNDPRLLATIESLATLYWNQRRLFDAERLCLRSLSIYERTRPDHHPDIGNIANRMAILYHTQGRYLDAENYYKKALSIKTKTLSFKHPELLKLLENYANLLYTMHRDEEAQHLLSVALSLNAGEWKPNLNKRVSVTTECEPIDVHQYQAERMAKQVAQQADRSSQSDGAAALPPAVAWQQQPGQQQMQAPHSVAPKHSLPPQQQQAVQQGPQQGELPEWQDPGKGAGNNAPEQQAKPNNQQDKTTTPNLETIPTGLNAILQNRRNMRERES